MSTGASRRALRAAREAVVVTRRGKPSARETTSPGAARSGGDGPGDGVFEVDEGAGGFEDAGEPGGGFGVGFAGGDIGAPDGEGDWGADGGGVDAGVVGGFEAEAWWGGVGFDAGHGGEVALGEDAAVRADDGPAAVVLEALAFEGGLVELDAAEAFDGVDGEGLDDHRPATAPMMARVGPAVDQAGASAAREGRVPRRTRCSGRPPRSMRAAGVAGSRPAARRPSRRAGREWSPM